MLFEHEGGMIKYFLSIKGKAPCMDATKSLAKLIRFSSFALLCTTGYSLPFKKGVCEQIPALSTISFEFKEEQMKTAMKFVMQALKKHDAKTLIRFFHPETRLVLSDLEASLAQNNSRYGVPLEYSVLHAWKLTNPSGDVHPISCFNQKLNIHPLAIYPEQYGVWVQVHGQRELARLYFSFVPIKDRWFIGTMQINQWTHQGQDYRYWLQQEQKYLNKNHLFLENMALTYATYLSDTGYYISLWVHGEIKKRFTKDYWVNLQKAIEQLFVKAGKTDILDVKPTFASEGYGLEVTFQIGKNPSSRWIIHHCQKHAKILFPLEDYRGLFKLQCRYVMKDPVLPSANRSLGTQSVYNRADLNL